MSSGVSVYPAPKASSFALDVSKGLIPGVTIVNKFGHATDCDNGVATDIWDGADGVTSTDIWVPPTTARVHQLASTSAADSAAGTGMRTIRVTYLADWDTAEQTTDLALNGVSNVATPSCVMIHRMQGLTWGTGGVNAGVITATADTDATVTASIVAGDNQTQMLVYGIPSTQTLKVFNMQCGIIKGTGTGAVFQGQVLYMPDPAANAANNTAWMVKQHFTCREVSNPWTHVYPQPKNFDGPGIVKMQGVANTNNSQVIATFDGFLVDN